MKKGLLLTSVLSIAMLTSIVSGATYALFMSEDEANIAITAGTVEVDAFVNKDSLRTYSMGVEQLNGKFENGGEATFDAESNLRLDLLTPGDSANFTVQIDNHSDVHIKYRVGLTMEGELASGLVTKAMIGGREYSLVGDETRWFELLAGEDIPDVLIDVELPTEAGNEYRATSATIKVKVEAVQRNAETVDTWNGKVDTEWYDGSASEYVLYTAEELAGLAALTNGEAGSSAFEGKTVVLGSHMDLKGLEWTPIANPMSDTYAGFAGTFDGNGYTISNLKVNNPSAWGQGLFGYNDSQSTIIRNLTINNATINAEDTSGAVGGYFQYGSFENIAVTGDIEITGAQHMGGIVGNGYYVDFIDCSVIGNEGSSITATAHSFVGGIVGYHGGGNSKKITNATVKNLDLTAFASVGAISGVEGTTNLIDGCLVENVSLTKTDSDLLPSVGLATGAWSNSGVSGAVLTITNNTFKNVTLNGTYTETASYEYNELFGTNYGGSAINGLVVESNNTKDNIVNNLKKNVPTVTVDSEEDFVAALSSVNGETIIDGSASNLTISVNSLSGNKLGAGSIIKGVTFSWSGTAYLEMGSTSVSDVVTFEDCVFVGGDRMTMQIATGPGCANTVFNNCTINGAVYSNLASNPQAKAEFNNCTFGLAGGMGYLNCMGGTQVLTNCTFDYTGGATYGSNQYLKWNAVNAYDESGRYGTNVTLIGCTRINCGTYTVGGGRLIER